MNEIAVSNGEKYREDTAKEQLDEKDVLLEDNAVVEVGVYLQCYSRYDYSRCIIF